MSKRKNKVDLNKVIRNIAAAALVVVILLIVWKIGTILSLAGVAP